MPLETQVWPAEPFILPLADATSADAAPVSDASGPRKSVRPIRVLHVINGEHYSGAERVQDLLASGLPEHGFEVGFACVKPGRFSVNRTCLRAPLFEIPMRGRFDFRVVRDLQDLIRDEGFELVHAHTPRTALVGCIAARRMRQPFVYHVHSPVTRDSTRRVQDWINGLVEKSAIRTTDQVICVSPSLQKYMIGRGVHESRVACVPNGVPVVPGVAPRSRPEAAWTLGSVALFRPRKGLEVLLEAMAALRSHNVNVRLRAVGAFESPEYESSMMCLTERLGLGEVVDWIGFCENVPSQLQQIDLFVLPSLFGEGLPMVVLEAMAVGLPVIATRVEGVPEAVDHRETGVLVEPGSVSQLTRGVEQVVQGELNYAHLSQAAINRHRDRFSCQRMAERTAQLYRKILD